MKHSNFGGGCFYGRQSPTNYEINKERARERAQEWQTLSANHNISYSELAEVSAEFAKLAKKYGLTKEFRINGII